MGLSNPVPGSAITQGFGYTGLGSNGPFTWNYNGKHYPSGFHTGLDLSAADGTKIRNVQYGVVVAASWNGCEPNGSCWGYGGGYVVIVKHNATPVYTSHAHMRGLYVKAGDPVYKGQPLGILNTRGYASGPHDHHSLWIKGLWPTVNGAYPLDPRSFWDGTAGAGNVLVQPSTVRVNAGVNLRSGPGTNYAIVGSTGGSARSFPYFKTVTGSAVSGADRRWRLIWSGRWSWVWLPLTAVTRGLAQPDEEVGDLSHLIEAANEKPTGGRELTVRAPGPYENWRLAEGDLRAVIEEPAEDPYPSRGSQSKIRKLLEQFEEVESI